MKRYKIKFRLADGKVVRITTLRWTTWDSAAWYLKNVCKFIWDDQKTAYVKDGTVAEITCQNGIPF